MRTAPAVAVEVGVSPAWRWTQAMLCAAAAAALGAWLLARAGQSAALGSLVALPAGLVAWLLSSEAPAALDWDGQQWRLDGRAVQVTLAIDLDRWLLLRLRSTDASARTRWLPATAAQAGPRWHGLRAALYSRAPESPLATAPRERHAVTPD